MKRIAVPVRLKVFVRKSLDDAREAVLRLQGARAGEKAGRCAKVVFIGGRDASCLRRIANLVVVRDRIDHRFGYDQEQIGRARH
jgi:hypothetical protein